MSDELFSITDPADPEPEPRCGNCAKWREHLADSGVGIGFGKCKMINRARMISEISKCRFTPSQHVERQLDAAIDAARGAGK